MCPFKLGDKVVCVNDDTVRKELRRGRTYTVYQLDENQFPHTMKVAEVAGRYVFSRFILAEAYQNPVGKELTKQVTL